jgi:hypothetical protein
LCYPRSSGRQKVENRFEIYDRPDIHISNYQNTLGTTPVHAFCITSLTPHTYSTGLQLAYYKDGDNDRTRKDKPKIHMLPEQTLHE